MISSQSFANEPGGDVVAAVTPDVDRHNGRLYLLSYMLIFLCGPVDYVGAVQAALCDKLGTNHAVANLPTATYSLGYIVPFLLASKVPYRLERRVVVIANLVTAASMAIVCAALFFPFGTLVRVSAVIFQGVILGFSACTSDVYMLQCLGRGTTESGRARTFKYTFALGPIMGVLGSLGAQYILNGGISWLKFPYEFGAIYLFCMPCMFGVALLSSRYRMTPIEEPPRPPLLQSVAANFKGYLTNRRLVVLWIAYFFWYVMLACGTNLTLYTREAVHKSPAALAGLSMALRFGGKSIFGFLLGAIAIRWGSFAPAKVIMVLGASALLWAWNAPGYLFLIAFMLMGAAELGGAYIPNSVLILSTAETGARNLSLLALAGPASSFAAPVYGAIADSWGFHASFGFGVMSALVSLILVSRIAREASRRAANPAPASG